MGSAESGSRRLALRQGCVVDQALVWSTGIGAGARAQDSSVLWYQLLRSVVSDAAGGERKIDFCAIDHTEGW